MAFFNNLSSLFNAKARQQRGGKATIGSKAPANLPPSKLVKQRQVATPSTKQVATHSGANFDNLKRVAQAQAKEIVVEAKAQALNIRTQAEAHASQVLKQAEEQQRLIAQKLDRIDLRLEQMDQKEANLEREKNHLQDLQVQVEQTKQKVLARLEELAGMTKDEAREYLLEQTKRRAIKDMAQIVRQKTEEMKAEADSQAKEILIEAMKYGATDYVAEYTMSTVTLPSEDAKGKIIGKSGRNIHAFEKITGVDVDLDVSPTEVKLSCFDPVRREIAKISLERLINRLKLKKLWLKLKPN